MYCDALPTNREWKSMFNTAPMQLSESVIIVIAHCYISFSIFNQESSQQYWPDDLFSPVKYGKITVIKTIEEQFQDYVMRKFEITGVPAKSMSVNTSKLSPSFVVTQFQYLIWSEDSVPTETASIIELLDKVNKVQMTTGNKSITVMCK